MSDAVLSAEQVCGRQPFLGDAVADLLVAVLPDEATRAAVRRRQVARWEVAAAASSGIARMSHLRRALELGTTFGVSDLLTRLRVELQSIREEDLDLKQVGASIDVSRSAIDVLVAALVGNDDFVSALRRIGAYGPPSGDPSRHEATALELRHDAPLSFLFPRTIIGPETTTLRVLATDDDKLEAQIRKSEMQSSQFTSIALIVPALKGESSAERRDG